MSRYSFLMQLIFIKLRQRNFHLGLLDNMKYWCVIMDLESLPFWKPVWWNMYDGQYIQYACIKKYIVILLISKKAPICVKI